MDTIAPAWLWAVFVLAVITALVIDFAVLRKQGTHAVGMQEAAWWSLLWVAVSLAFNGLLWWALNSTQGTAVANARSLEFLTGYLVEKSLAVDNLFVFLMVFSYFSVPPALQKRLLMMGIIGAIVLRTAVILAGAWLIAQAQWILYVFGAFLVLTGIKMWRSSGAAPGLDSNPALKLLRRLMPVSAQLDGERLFTVQDGKRIATPLLLVVALIGITDLIFAVDSIPAIFAITMDPFIVLTSNIFAVLGLWAMYFLLAALAGKFHLLSYGLALVLVFIGGKMLLADVWHVPPLASLGVVLAILVVTMLWSLKTAPKAAAPAPAAR